MTTQTTRPGTTIEIDGWVGGNPTDPDPVRVNLTLDYTCRRCGGAGVIEAALWRQFGAAEQEQWGDKGIGARLTEAYQQWASDWWAERGWDWRINLAGAVRDRLPPEEESCEECDGRGLVLTEAGQALIAWVRELVTR